MLNFSHSSNFNSHYLVACLVGIQYYLNLRSGTKIDFVIFGYNFDIFSYCMNFIVTKEATDRTREKIVHLKQSTYCKCFKILS